MSIAGVVVVHEPVPELERCLSALKPQVDELVVVSNLGLELPVPEGARLIRNDEPAGFAANANRGIAETAGEFVVVCNPDTEADPGALAVLLAFAEFHQRMGIAGPELRKPDGSWNASRRRFPTVSGTIVRRTPLRRWLGGTQKAHYGLDEQPTEPVQADWLLGAFLFLRREMLDELGGFDEGYRLYGEDIDLAYRASKAGWERWYVPAAKAVHAHQAVTDRRHPHAPDAVALARDPPLRAQAPGAAEGPLSTIARWSAWRHAWRGRSCSPRPCTATTAGSSSRPTGETRTPSSGSPTSSSRTTTRSRGAGIVRGMHFQPGQSKLVRCARGSVLDVVVDLRRGSPTFGEWEAVELDAERHLQLYVPDGFAHGFCVLSDVADLTYKVSTYYDPAGGVRLPVRRSGRRHRVAGRRAAAVGAGRERPAPQRAGRPASVRLLSADRRRRQSPGGALADRDPKLRRGDASGLAGSRRP